MDKQIEGLINLVYIFLFYFYLLDDGFLVIDYYEVYLDWGNWDVVENLVVFYCLMFDVVVNYIFQELVWFKGFLVGEEKYVNYFLEDDFEKDYFQVVWLRVLLFLYDYVDSEGCMCYVWIIFSCDQVDINYCDFEVFLQVLDLLFFYVSKGVKFICLDVIGFMWKEDGISCIYLFQIYNFIKVMCVVLVELVLDLIFIMEINVFYFENIFYFGNGFDEVQMVYNFILFFLLVYSLLEGNGDKFICWVQSFELLSVEVCFFNFIVSYDGVGLWLVIGILE